MERIYMGLYMYLEKAYNRTERDKMRKVLSMYEINDNLLRAIQSFYEESEARVRICREEGEWLSVKAASGNVVLYHHGCLTNL